MVALPELPYMGVGQRWDDASSAARLKYLGEGIDFIEPSLPVDLSALAGLPMVTHSSELGLATSGELNARMLDAIADQVRQVAPPWTGEHFSLVSTIPSGDLGYNFAPILDDRTLEDTARNMLRLMERFGCPVALEAGPRYFPMGGWDDYGAIYDVSVATGCPILLDLSHHIVSMHNLGRTPRCGLTAEVLERTMEIHVTGVGRHRSDDFLHDHHGSPVPDMAWELLDWVLQRTPALRAITLEHDATVPDAAYAKDLRKLVERMR